MPWHAGRKAPQLSDALKGKLPWNKGKKFPYRPLLKLRGRRQSEEARRKRRLTMLHKIEERHGQVFPNYNPTACELINEYGKTHGFAFQHAENGGEFHIKELGYFVDGYDAKKNVVIEVYEPAHQRTIKRDERRQQEIEHYLGCTFIVLKIGE